MPEKIDSQVPSAVVKQVFEDHGSDQSKWSEDLKALMSPSIVARPLHMPSMMRIKRRLNTDFEYFAARDREGTNPNHERVGELKSLGFDFATTDDVEMENSASVKSKSEIRSGDLVLMKVPKQIWYGIRKQQQLDAIRLTKRADPSRSVLMSSSHIPGVRTELAGEQDLASIMANRVLDNSSEGPAVENFTTGNTTRVSSKGAR